VNSRDEVFSRARADRAYAAIVTRDMVLRATTAPQFKPGLGARLRGNEPDEAIDALASLFARHGDQDDAAALYRLAAIVRDHALTWVEIDGN